MSVELAMSPLQLDPLTRDYFGQYDAYAIGQLAPLYDSECYTPKFYKAPASKDELILANGYATCGLHITPGSLIFGFYLPALVAVNQVNIVQAPLYSVQITDAALDHKFFNEPIPAFFLGNIKPTALSQNPLNVLGAFGSFPSLFQDPYPVVGDGLFMVEFWDTLGGNTYAGTFSQRIELIFGVLEVVRKC